MQRDQIVGMETRDTAHYFLATTEPGAVEENPLFWWELTIVNGRSHTPLPADVFVYWRPADSSPNDFEQLACVCRQKVQCRFAFPGRYADVLYRVEVQAAGYVSWSRDFRTNTQRTRTMKAPVELFDAGRKGFGLRAAEPVYSSNFIIEYIGSAITKKAFLKLEAKRRSHPKHRRYCVQLAIS